MAARVLEGANEPLRESMRTFEGIPHRLEFIRERNGVRYVNDSKATNVNAVWYALESFSEPVILIAGGIDKGNDYEEIAALVKNKVRGLITIGSAAERIEERSEEHTSELQSRGHLVCRLLLEKKKQN